MAQESFSCCGNLQLLSVALKGTYFQGHCGFSEPHFSKTENILFLKKCHVIYININKLCLSYNLDKESLGPNQNKKQVICTEVAIS